MTLALALAIALALTAGAYTAGAIALLLGVWRSGNRVVVTLLVIALIAFAVDRTYPPSLSYAAMVAAIAAVVALFAILRTRIEGPRDILWALFAAVPAIELMLLASADSFAPGVASTLRAIAVALFTVPGVAALVFYFTGAAKLIVP